MLKTQDKSLALIYAMYWLTTDNLDIILFKNKYIIKPINSLTIDPNKLRLVMRSLLEQIESFATQTSSPFFSKLPVSFANFWQGRPAVNAKDLVWVADLLCGHQRTQGHSQQHPHPQPHQTLVFPLHINELFRLQTPSNHPPHYS